MKYQIKADLATKEGKDLALSGREKIRLAEREMPGLMALRQEFAAKKPLSSAKIVGSLHVTKETAVLMETLKLLGAELSWSACNVMSTQDDVAAALVQEGFSIFAWRGMTEADYWRCIDQTLDLQADLIIDDGGDLTQHLHEKRPELFAQIKGISEETSTGVRRLQSLAKRSLLKAPAISVNDSVTKSKFDNLYGCRESLVDGIKRACDLMIAGKIAVVIGYGDVGKGSAQALRALGARVCIVEIDPICAYQALMNGFELKKMDELAAYADLFITASGCKAVIGKEEMMRMKKGAILANIGHFDCEIDMQWLNSHADCKTIKEGLDQYTWKDAKEHDLLVLAQGRLVNLVCANGHPSYVMSNSFCNQVLAQIELWTQYQKYEKKVYRLPRILDEKVARLHLGPLAAKLSTLSEEQAKYLDLPIQGPYKDDNYRY